MTGIGSEAAGVIIDDMGKLLPPHPLYLAQRLGCPTGDFDVITHAVRNLGFVSIAPVRGALLVKFEPATVRRLAAIAAFYEIAGRAPKRLILACPGKAGHPDRYEIFQDLGEGLRRLEAALEGRRDAPAEPPSLTIARQRCLRRHCALMRRNANPTMRSSSRPCRKREIWVSP